MASTARSLVTSCVLLLVASCTGDPAPGDEEDADGTRVPACPLGTVECAGGCVDLQQSAANCGACGAACPAGASCVAGACACQDGLDLCGAACVNLQGDGANCGACGAACPAGASCVAGACACQDGLDLCGAACVNLQGDGANCGACGAVCVSPSVCSAGLCSATGCTIAGQTQCGSSCVDLASDPANCGACGTACGAGQSCVSGVCGCPATATACSGACVDTATDNANCGACGVTCTGGQSCRAGACACAAGQTVCGGVCTDLATDPGNCGACGVGCSAGEACQAGTCIGGTGGSPGTGGTGPGTGSGVSFSPPSGTFEGTVSVTLAVADPGAEIRFTLDGTLPTATSELYTGAPLALGASAQIIATAFVDGVAVTRPAAAVYVQRAIDVTVDLPLLVLDSYGAGLPEGEGESSGWGMPTTTDRPFLDAALLVYADAGATLSGTPTLATRAGFHLRGNSSAMFPKPPYRLELRDVFGEDAKHEMLGMPADGDWVLRNPYADKALVRDAFFYGLAADLGFKAPRFAFCELYRNGGPGPLDAEDYLGVYLLVETIENSDERVSLQQLKETDVALPAISGGYIFKFEWQAVEEPEVECLSASHCWADLEVVDPVPLNAEQEAWLEQHLSGFADALFGDSFGDPSAGYAPYIDVGSFVDQVILNELGREMDAYIRSQHFYKDRDGKIFAGPIWDRDLTFGVGGSFENDQIEGWQYEQTARGGGGTGFPGMAMSPGNDWFPRLMQDPGFVATLVARWKELRQGQLSDAALDARVDRLTAPLAAAAARNFAKWDILTDEMVPANMFHTSTEDTWEGQVASMRSWMHQRVAWLDTQWQ